MTRIGSLFSGAGGLDLAVMDMLGGDLAWHCEIDPAASAVLRHHWPDLPNLGDITAVDWAYVEPVDVVTAGWPCQPWSVAGKRKGIEDDRALWPEVARAIRLVRPRLVVLENVPAIVAAGELARAVTDLAACGYVGSWACVRADEVGAAHRRDRVFVAAADADRAGRLWSGPPRADLRIGDRAARRDDPVHLLPTPRATDGTKGGPGQRGSSGDLMLPSAVPSAEGSDWGPYAAAIARWASVLGRPAPPPTITGARGGRKLNPDLVDWLMGWPAGWTDVPGVSVNDRLRIGGNGVVPQQGAAALRWLLPRLVDGRAAA